MRFSIGRKFGCVLVACGLLLLSACTTTSTRTVSIEERATARWDALLAGDLAGAYEYLSPGYRSSVTSIQYQRFILLNRVQWRDVEYISDECEESVCTVKFVLNYTLVGALPGVRSFKGKTDIKESWVMSDGQWYYVPEQ